MNNALQGLLLAAGVIITCVIISMSLYLTRQGQNAGSEMSKVYSSITATITDNDINDYVLDEITGADVVNFIRKYHEDIDIFTLQRTLSDQSGQAWQGTNIVVGPVSDLALNYKALAWNEANPQETVSMSDGANTYSFKIDNYFNGNYVLTENNFSKNIPGTSMYINPNNKYRGFEIKNNNGVITGVYFVQQNGIQTAITPGGSGAGAGAGSGSGSGGTPSSGSGSGVINGGSGIDNDTFVAMSNNITELTEKIRLLTEEIGKLKTDMYNALGSSPGTGSGSGSTTTPGSGVDTSEIYTQISNISTQYQELSRALQDVQTALETDIGTMSSSLQGVTQDNAEEIAQIRVIISQIEGKFSTIDSKLETISAQIDAINYSGITTGSSISSTAGQNSISALNTLNEVNAELISVSDLILSVSNATNNSTEGLNASISSMKEELKAADEVTDQLCEEAVK